MSSAIFLDRDGTINVDHSYVGSLDRWEFCPRAPEALQLLQGAGYKLVVVTNQSGIARGYYTEADMHTVHTHMQDELTKQGVTLNGIAYCPHNRDEGCVCRKPQTAMLDTVSEILVDVTMATSWTIGDRVHDVEFGKNIGTKTAIILSPYWQPESLTVSPDMVVDSLYDFAVQITHT